MRHPFNFPNIDKNVKLIEKTRGILMIYTLPCKKDFPGLSFISQRGVGYYQLGYRVPYQNNMSMALTDAYYKLKNRVMLDLAYYRRNKLNQSIQKLEYQQAKLF